MLTIWFNEFSGVLLLASLSVSKYVSSVVSFSCIMVLDLLQVQIIQHLDLVRLLQFQTELIFVQIWFEINLSVIAEGCSAASLVFALNNFYKISGLVLPNWLHLINLLKIAWFQPKFSSILLNLLLLFKPNYLIPVLDYRWKRIIGSMLVPVLWFQANALGTSWINILVSVFFKWFLKYSNEFCVHKLHLILVVIVFCWSTTWFQNKLFLQNCSWFDNW